MPALDALSEHGQQRVAKTKDLVVSIVKSVDGCEPEVQGAIRLLCVEVLSLSARAEYAEERLADLRAIVIGPL